MSIDEFDAILRHGHDAAALCLLLVGVGTSTIKSIFYLVLMSLESQYSSSAGRCELLNHLIHSLHTCEAYNCFLVQKRP